jgi:hypothetical protein
LPEDEISQNHQDDPTSGQTPAEDSRGQSASKRDEISAWRIGAFILLTITALIVGAFFKVNSDAPKPDPEWFNRPPVQMAFYVSNPHMSLRIRVTSHWILSSEVFFQVLLSVKGDSVDRRHGSILIFTNGIRPPDEFKYSAFFRYGQDYVSILPVVNWSNRGLGGESSGWTDYLVVLNFLLPREEIYRQVGPSLYGHLPAVNYFTSVYGLYQGGGLEEYAVQIGAARPVGSNFYYLQPVKIDNLRGLLTFTKKQEYWDPATSNVEETIINFVQQVRKAPITTQEPNGTLEGADYLWSGPSLDPTFVSTDTDAQDRLNNNAFYSGIAFGVAGAGLIGVIQEMPKQLPPPTWALNLFSFRNVDRWRASLKGRRIPLAVNKRYRRILPVVKRRCSRMYRSIKASVRQKMRDRQ